MARDFGHIEASIQEKVKEIALILMKHENKNFCLAQVPPHDWRTLSTGYRHFIIVPSLKFKRLIIDREYLSIVDTYHDCFGTSNDYNIIKAIKDHEKPYLVREYSDDEFLECITNEAMAYVFEIIDSSVRSDRILRLDLCRGIRRDYIFMGGLFHALKHFTLKEYKSLSSFPKEYIVESWLDIFENIILNFYSEDFILDEKEEKHYVAKSELKDGHILRGVYYKEDSIPVSFLCSLRIDGIHYSNGLSKQ